MPQLLIVTTTEDPHADAVIRWLAVHGPTLEIVRLNTGTLAVNCEIDFAWSRDGSLVSSTIVVKDSAKRLENVKVIWWRKPDSPEPHPDLSDRDAKACSQIEYREFLKDIAGIYHDAQWVNSYWSMQKYHGKPSQFRVAKQVGLPVPATLLSNTAGRIRHFARVNSPIIVKPL